MRTLYEYAAFYLLVLPGALLAFFGLFLVGLVNPEVAKALELASEKLGEYIKELEEGKEEGK